VLKGGKCGEFWSYDPAHDTWIDAGPDSFPTPSGKKRDLPYAGADLCYGAGKIFALRGTRPTNSGSIMPAFRCGTIR